MAFAEISNLPHIAKHALIRDDRLSLTAFRGATATWFIFAFEGYTEQLAIWKFMNGSVRSDASHVQLPASGPEVHRRARN